jgi:hypothetical protein
MYMALEILCTKIIVKGFIILNPDNAALNADTLFIPSDFYMSYF